MVSIIYHLVMSAELLKSAVERAGRLKVLSWEVLSGSAVSLILVKKEVLSVTAYEEACQNNPQSGYLHLLFLYQYYSSKNV